MARLEHPWQDPSSLSRPHETPGHPVTNPRPRHDSINIAEREDLITELAQRLEALDALLTRLEDAERQAASASEHLQRTRQWQEETIRTIQDERARMRQRQQALDDLAEHARAAVNALMASYRSLPQEVTKLAIELQVLESSGFLSRPRRNRLP